MKSRRIAGPLFLLLIIASFGMWLHGAVPDVPTGQWLPGPALAQPRAGAVSVALDDGRVLVIGGRTANGPVRHGGSVQHERFAEPSARSCCLATRGPHSDEAAGRPRPRRRRARRWSRRMTERAGDRGSGDGLRGGLRRERGCLVSGGVAVDRAQRAHGDGGCRRPRRGGRRRGDGRCGARLVRGVRSGERGVLVAGSSLGGAYGARRRRQLARRRCSWPAAATRTACSSTADIIDVDGGTVTAVVLNAPRAGASATTLLDGKILVAGGSDGANDLASAEVVDPADRRVSAPTASMAQPRRGHQALLLANNNTVLITGGTNGGAVAFRMPSNSFRGRASF